MRQSLLLGTFILAAALAAPAQAAVITVQKPIGGAIWSVGQPHTIEWTRWLAYYRKANATVYTGMKRQGFLLVKTRWPGLPGARPTTIEEPA